MGTSLPNKRAQLLELLARVGRENSDATVLFHAEVAARIGLHPTDYKLLGIIERRGALSAGEIAEAAGLATASVTNLIDRLEAKGFVKRTRHATDRRKILVEPTLGRAEAARKVFASVQKNLAALYEHYSDKELAVIADFLNRNAIRLREATADLDGHAKRH